MKLWLGCRLTDLRHSRGIHACPGHSDEKGARRPARPHIVSIRKNCAVFVQGRHKTNRAAQGKSAEKYPRGVHHEMRAHVFAASLSSLSLVSGR
jgi:hypothetical protein